MIAALVVATALCASPRPEHGSERWDFLDAPRARPANVAAPTAFMFDRAIEDMQGALGEWQKERRDFDRDVALTDRIREKRAAPAAASDDGQAGPPADASKAKKAAGRGDGSKIKVIEIAPPSDGSEDDGASPPQEDAPVESEIRKLDAELRDRERLCKEDPDRCAREKEKRRIVREGNRAWDEAIEKKQHEREEAIEAEARKIQAELDAARKREAQERAKKMGGAIDDNGNFVDQDLDRAIEEGK